MTVKTPLSGEQIEWFRKSWVADLPIRTICQTLHISDVRASKIARGMGLPPHPRIRPQTLTAAEIERIKKLRADGLKIREIMAITGRSLTSVFKYCDIRKRRSYTGEERQRACDLYRELGSIRKVARTIGANDKTISDWINGVGGRTFNDEPRPVIPPHVLEERNHRLSLMRRDDPSQLFGDPLPGYSYLERRT